MGTFLEERWGTRNWLIVYWVGGLGGNLLSCVASPDKVKGPFGGAVLLCPWSIPSHPIRSLVDSFLPLGHATALRQAVGRCCHARRCARVG